MNLIGDNPAFRIDEFTYERHSRFGPRVQKNLQLIYIFEGWARININGVERFLEPGEASLLLPGDTEYFAFGNAPLTRHGWTEVIQPKLEPATLKAYRTLPLVAPCTDLMQVLHAQAFAVGPPISQSSQRLRDALATAILNAYFHALEFGDQVELPLPAPVAKARAYMADHYAEPVDINTLAGVANVSGAHLIRLFRKHLETTPIAYLWELRVREGVRLLRQTGLSISEIAYRVGFQTPYHFSRLVTKHHGKPPRQLRREYWGKG